MNLTKRPIERLGIFAFFATYGPVLGIVGQLRYTEIAILSIFAFNITKVWNSRPYYMKFLIYLFLINIMSLLLSNYLNNSSVESTAKRAGTYLLLIVILLTLSWFARERPLRLMWIILGFYASYLFVYLFNIPTPSMGYLTTPWRLGMGRAATVIVCLFFIFNPRYRRWGGFTLIVLAIIHFVEGARGLGLIAASTGVLYTYAIFFGLQYPSRIAPLKVVLVLVIGVILVYLTWLIAIFATENRLFPPEVQSKMEMQLNSPYGLVAAARPDFYTALYAISKRPFLGYGSGNVDPDVFAFYAEVAASAYYSEPNYEAVLDGTQLVDWSDGTPAHSHILGAWADAGVLAALSWFAVLMLAFYVILRSIEWRNSWSLIYIFFSLITIWDVLFSPGPNRLEMAIFLTILFFAINQFSLLDMQKKRRRLPTGTQFMNERR